MKEHPILFSAPMVLALLDGRKTQTRRLNANRYGVPGDHLWVRESLRRRDDATSFWTYAADDKAIKLPANHPDVGAMLSWAHHKEGSSCPSIHMPRWASRITLEVIELRQERLQYISEADAKAEGYFSTRESFAVLWEKINGKVAPWSSNPRVWVVTFKVIKGGLK